MTEEIPESPGLRTARHCDGTAAAAARRRDVILPFKKYYFNFKTATTKPGGGAGVLVAEQDESHLSYKRACYLLTGTTPIVCASVQACVWVCVRACVRASVYECVAAGWGEGCSCSSRPREGPGAYR